MGKSRIDLEYASLEEQKRQIERLCPCCGRDPEITPIDLTCDTIELADFGSGFVAYFSLVKFLVFALCIFGALSIYKIQADVNGRFCLTEDQASKLPSSSFICVKDWITRHSVANYGFEVDTTDKALMCVFFGIMLFAVGIFNAYSKKLAEEIDTKNDLPSDWTVILRGLSPDITDQDIALYFNQFKLKNGTCPEVISVNSSYKIEGYNDQVSKVQKAKNALKIVTAKEISEIKERLERDGQKEKAIDESMFSPEYKTALETFNSETKEVQGLA